MLNTRLSLLALSLIVGLAACDFLTTRDPEDPESSGSSFVQPTSADIVLQNFSGSIREKNDANYERCFVPEESAGIDELQAYCFEPSAEAAQRFVSVFSGWSLKSEREAFVAMIANVPEHSIPSLLLTKPFTEFEIQTPDSVIYVSDYQFVPGFAEPVAADTVVGKLTFTIARLANSTWAISRWTDQAITTSGSERETWSALKGQLTN